MNNFARRLWLTGLLFLLATHTSLLAGNPAPPAENQAQIHVLERSPRNFGFVLGDIIRQRFLLTLPAGQQLNQHTLPRPGRLNDWLDLREFHITPQQEATNTQTTNPHAYELDFTYQLFKQVDAPGNITIPSTTLLIVDNDPLALPKWTISYGTLLPGKAQKPIPLRPPSDPKTVDTEHWLQLFYIALVGLLLCLLIGLCWYYLPFFQRHHQAFTRANRQLKKLKNRSPSDPQQALNIFQQALTESAGKTLFPDQLDPYFKDHPHYKPLAEGTDKLLQQSYRARFAPEHEKSALPDTDAIQQLCQAFSQKEQAAWER